MMHETTSVWLYSVLYSTDPPRCLRLGAAHRRSWCSPRHRATTILILSLSLWIYMYILYISIYYVLYSYMGLFIAIINIKYNMYNIIYMYISTLNYIIYIYYIKHAFLSSAWVIANIYAEVHLPELRPAVARCSHRQRCMLRRPSHRTLAPTSRPWWGTGPQTIYI